MTATRRCEYPQRSQPQQWTRQTRSRGQQSGQCRRSRADHGRHAPSTAQYRQTTLHKRVPTQHRQQPHWTSLTQSQEYCYYSCRRSPAGRRHHSPSTWPFHQTANCKYDPAPQKSRPHQIALTHSQECCDYRVFHYPVALPRPLPSIWQHRLTTEHKHGHPLIQVQPQPTDLLQPRVWFYIYSQLLLSCHHPVFHTD